MTGGDDAERYQSMMMASAITSMYTMAVHYNMLSKLWSIGSLSLEPLSRPIETCGHEELNFFDTFLTCGCETFWV